MTDQRTQRDMTDGNGVQQYLTAQQEPDAAARL
jgi:hypothetical protein